MTRIRKTSREFITPEFCDKENLLTIMQIARTKNIGPITFLNLFAEYKTPSKILKKLEILLKNKNKLQNLAQREAIEREYNDTINYGGNIISIFDEKYPELLRECDDPPIIISYVGEIEKISSKNTIGFVGARNCSHNGIGLSYKFAKKLCEDNFTIVSGLAKGIDGSSHKGALDANNQKHSDKFIPTVAVIGGGIDNIYPKENTQLFRDIRENGIIISEYPFGTKPKAENFPKRNRIISALSQAVLIVEATLKSGSLITARIALEQNREVMCIPGSPLDDRSKGCNKLIKDGAHIITEINDIAEIFNNSRPLQHNLNIEPHFGESDPQNFDIEDIYKDDELNAEENNIDTMAELNHTAIIENITYSPIDINELAKIANLSIKDVNAIILEYELEGTITRHPGNKISKIA